MAKGSGKGSRSVTPYNSSRNATVVPVSSLSRTSYKPAQSQAYEKTTRVRQEDKQSGSYQRYSVKEKASRGDLHVEKRTGQVGVKDEFTNRSTVKIGNRSGYTEYQTEERFRNVKFGTSSGGGGGGLLNYEDDYDIDNNAAADDNGDYNDEFESDSIGNNDDYSSDHGGDFDAGGIDHGGDCDDGDSDQGGDYDDDHADPGNDDYYDNYSDNDDY